MDLNTENDYVADYIVECYGNFIKMGVDAFRIDTTGHISPLTFNTQFIPRFHEIANLPEVRAKRLNGTDFYMFGECCQRYQGTVVYRGQPNLSSYFYTWKSDQSLINQFKETSSAEWWRGQTLNEGHDTPVGPMKVCESDTKDKPRSNNAWMVNGQWHEPDYSQASGFNVIDFPVHYSFNSVSNVMGLYSQDNYYNDATWNVVYVDSHDYCPGPNDGMRFNGGTSQWAENLSWMFTFRGIPCIYYGSEVEFKKGLPIDVGGSNNKTPRSESGRAYFGAYLEGSVSASDFAQYTASGNVAKTLSADLAHHIQQLNKIRAAVPALRKGQYTIMMVLRRLLCQRRLGIQARIQRQLCARSREWRRHILQRSCRNIYRHRHRQDIHRWRLDHRRGSQDPGPAPRTRQRLDRRKGCRRG